MFLKSLEISGFKSFPDKTRLSFPHGITAVVGPNGSGKSNISDAIRWVLGEQSTKTLRSSKMDEVIFSGTQTRHRMGRARVTLTLDNTDRTLPMDEDEVSVQRTFYRDGDGEYRINGVAVRLRDVHELFMDTGLGRDGYALIGQGRISQIINQKSEDRREIFEEAAGIAKFRFRKEEAEKRLRISQDNLLRLMDILSELEERLEPLRVQAEKAQQFITLSAEKKELEISLWVHELKEMEEELRQLRHRQDRLEQDKKEASRLLEQCEAAMEENFSAMQQNAAMAEEQRAELGKDESLVSQSAAQDAVLDNEIGHTEEALHRLTEELSEGKSAVKELEEKLKKAESAAEKIHLHTEESAQELKKLQEQEDRLSQEEAQVQTGIAGAAQHYRELENAAGAVRVLLASVKTRMEELESRRRTLHTTTQQREQKKTALLEEETECRKLLTELDGLLESGNNVLAGMQLKKDNRKEHLAELRQSHTDMEKTMEELRQRIKILEDLEKNLEGYNHSVQYILKRGKDGSLPGVCAAVSQVVSSRDEHVTAIEVALGGAMQNIITEDETCAKQAIQALQKKNRGRATFLPLTTLRIKELPEKADVIKEEGILGTADSLVQCEEKYRPAVEFLLGRIVIADTLDTALDVGKQYRFNFKLVTLDGQVVNPGGSMTGGSVSHQAGVLTRRHTIEKLTRQLEALSPRWEESEKEIASQKKELEALDSQMQAHREDIQTMREDRIRAQSEAERLERQLKELDDLFKDARTLGEELEQQTEEQTAFLAEQKKREASIAAKLAACADQSRETTARLEAVRNARRELSEEKNRESMAHLGLERDEENARREIERIREEKAQEHLSRQEKKARCKALEEKRLSLGEEKQMLAQRTQEAAGRITAAKERLKALSGARMALEAKAVSLRGEQKEHSARHEEHIRGLASMQEKLNTRIADYERIVGDIWKEYELSKSRAFAAAKPVEEPQEANRRLMQLRLTIKNLGTVNLEAVEEFKEVSKRCDFMRAQMEDAQKAKDRLTRMIFELTGQMREIFVEKFRNINYNFSQTFHDLFGGGTASLELDSPDVLTAGILLRVQPPGKLIRNLAALSGGEQALTAIALYFAILQVQPAPFCILDEIEAALDDVNVARFAQYLHRLNVDTQFVAITHRRGTMEQADMLYGVTMQEEGVSSLLELSMDEVQERWQLD